MSPARPCPRGLHRRVRRRSASSRRALVPDQPKRRGPRDADIVRDAAREVALDLEAAARSLGLNNRRIFFRVTLPLAAKGVLAATALAFARALGDFGVTIMIAGNIPGKTQTASVAIYDAVQAGRDNEALTLAVIVSVLAVLLLYVINRFGKIL